MKKDTKHIIIGTVICAAMMLLFLGFSNKLPENVPVQITIDGSVGNTMPKNLFIFGLPIIFAVVSLVKGFSLNKKQNVKIYNYYIIPGIAVLLSAAILFTALNFQGV